LRKTLHRPENLALIELLRELRLAADLRQAELAQRLGVNQNFVSNVEQGIRRLDLVELRDYATALDVPFLELTARWEYRVTGEKPAARRKNRAGSS
jgi:transcriptional regulator with XRE-family HTH domain